MTYSKEIFNPRIFFTYSRELYIAEEMSKIYAYKKASF